MDAARLLTRRRKNSLGLLLTDDGDAVDKCETRAIFFMIAACGAGDYDLYIPTSYLLLQKKMGEMEAMALECLRMMVD